MTTKLTHWFGQYSEHHQNPTNKKLHFFCVPLIFFSLIGLLSFIHFPVEIAGLLEFNFGMDYLFLAIGLVFYMRHSVKIFLSMAIVSVACEFLIHQIRQQQIFPAPVLFADIFIFAWMGQFIGHKMEGKKPSFLSDIVFLLIGPAWIINIIYQKIKVRSII